MMSAIEPIPSLCLLINDLTFVFVISYLQLSEMQSKIPVLTTNFVQFGFWVWNPSQLLDASINFRDNGFPGHPLEFNLQ